MTNVTKIIEVINANGRQGPKDLKSREVYNWVKRDLDISYEDYLSVLQANAIPADERMRFRNAYFIVSSSGVYSFFKSSEEELRPYICYIIYKTPYLRSSEIKDRMKEIYPHFTLIDQMLQQNLTAPQCVVDQTIRNVLVSNYERQANRELFERSPVRPYIYTIKPDVYKRQACRRTKRLFGSDFFSLSCFILFRKPEINGPHDKKDKRCGQK